MARLRLDPPERCPDGHWLRTRAGYRVIWLPCLCAGGPGHHVWICGQCDVATYVPPHTDDQFGTGRFGSLYAN